MEVDNSETIFDLKSCFDLPSTCETATIQEPFIWGGDDREMFDKEAVEIDYEGLRMAERMTKNVSLSSDDEPDFKVLGEEKFIKQKKIQIRPAWVKAAKVFEKDIKEDSCESLKNFPGLKRKLYKRLKENIHAFFPVQSSLLSYLLPLSTSLPVFPQRDVAISAPTGSGKTLCYLLPIINALEHSDPSAVFAVVIAPLQLLAVQIFEEFKKYNVFNTSMVLLSGAQEYETERRALFPDNSKTSKVSIIVATPERLVEHLTDLNGKIELSTLRYLVIDEADRMKNVARMEWLNLVEHRANVKTAASTTLVNLESLAQNRWLQKILVSATLNLDVEHLFIWNLRCPRLFRSTGQENEDAKTKIVAPSVALPSTMSHTVIICESQRKPLDVYCWILKNPEWKRIMVFVNNKESVDRLTMLLGFMFKKDKVVCGLSADYFKNRRLRALKQFADGEINVLVSTDSTGRGVDIPDVDCVVNYDLPKTDRTFVHRAGRTARAGKSGTVLSFATKEEKLIFKKILIQRGYWETVTEAPKEDLSTTKDRVAYKKALDKLQAKYGKNE